MFTFFRPPALLLTGNTPFGTGSSYKTVQAHIDLLKGAYLIRDLLPFEVNVRKRIKKSPALLFRDTGNLHNFLRISQRRHFDAHPKRGFSWEAFCSDQIIRMAEVRESDCFRYSVQGGAEVDLVIAGSGARIGFEFKSGDAPKVTESMRTGVEDLGLDALYIVYPGDGRAVRAERIEEVGIERLPEVCERIRDGG